MNGSRAARVETLDSAWGSLYRIGGAAALGAAALLAVEIAVFVAYPLPSTVAESFARLQGNRLIGLLDAYLLEMLAYMLYVPMFLALYVALRRGNESLMLLAVALAGVGIAVFLATNNPFAMLSLGDGYAAATDEQRAIYVAAGQALLANTGQRAAGGFNVGLFLVAVAGLIVALVMRGSSAFGSAAAFVGILANALTLADYVRLMVAPDARLLVLLLAVASGLFLLVWYVLIARGLFRFARLV